MNGIWRLTHVSQLYNDVMCKVQIILIRLMFDLQRRILGTTLNFDNSDTGNFTSTDSVQKNFLWQSKANILFKTTIQNNRSQPLWHSCWHVWLLHLYFNSTLAMTLNLVKVREILDKVTHWNVKKNNQFELWPTITINATNIKFKLEVYTQGLTGKMNF